MRTVLEQFGDKYLLEGQVHKQKVIADLSTYDQSLLEKLMKEPLIADHFTAEIGEQTVVQVNKLIALFEADEYWENSYTTYLKKIGLTVNGSFLDEATEVVLDFP